MVLTSTDGARETDARAVVPRTMVTVMATATTRASVATTSSTVTSRDGSGARRARTRPTRGGRDGRGRAGTRARANATRAEGVTIANDPGKADIVVSEETRFEAVIGIETHVQLNSKAKAFVDARTSRRRAEHEGVSGVHGTSRDASAVELGGGEEGDHDRDGARDENSSVE